MAFLEALEDERDWFVGLLGALVAEDDLLGDLADGLLDALAAEGDLPDGLLDALAAEGDLPDESAVECDRLAESLEVLEADSDWPADLPETSPANSVLDCVLRELPCVVFVRGSEARSPLWACRKESASVYSKTKAACEVCKLLDSISIMFGSVEACDSEVAPLYSGG